jgi:hypothetical protein
VPSGQSGFQCRECPYQSAAVTAYIVTKKILRIKNAEALAKPADRKHDGNDDMDYCCKAKTAIKQTKASAELAQHHAALQCIACNRADQMQRAHDLQGRCNTKVSFKHMISVLFEAQPCLMASHLF